MNNNFKQIKLVFYNLLLVLIIVYIVMIPFGVISKDNRWQTEEVIILVILAILSSGLLEYIAEINVGKDGISAKFKQLEAKQEQQNRQLSNQQAEIRSLKVALQGIVTKFELDKLINLNQKGAFLCYYSEDLYDELKRLRAMQFVQNYQGVGLGSIKRDYKDKSQKFDLKQYFYITEQGVEYLKLRGQIEQN